jgi:hypothetical protein
MLLLQVCLLFRRFCLGTTGARTGRSKAKHMPCIASCIFLSLLLLLSSRHGPTLAVALVVTAGHSPTVELRSAPLAGPHCWTLDFRICDIAFAVSRLRPRFCGVLQTVSCQLTWWVCCCTGEPYLFTCQWHF